MSDAGGKHYLDAQPRRTVTMAGARRHAWMARGVRVLFFAGIVVIAAAVAWYVFKPKPVTEEEPEPEIAATQSEPGVIRVVNPHFTGRDAKNRPFQVLADTAIRRPNDDAAVTQLVSPCFYDNTDSTDDWRARVCARGGVYNTDAKTLELDTDVDLQTKSGYVFKTDHARVFVDQHRAEGDNPVAGAGPFGTVTAKRWAYDQDASILHFEGNVQTVFPQDEGAQEDAQQ